MQQTDNGARLCTCKRAVIGAYGTCRRCGGELRTPNTHLEHSNG